MAAYCRPNDEEQHTVATEVTSRIRRHVINFPRTVIPADYILRVHCKDSAVIYKIDVYAWLVMHKYIMRRTLKI